jgi:gliding motility-associated-like protein
MKLFRAEFENRKRFLVSILIFLGALSANCQTDLTPPDAPLLTIVTINQSTGYTDISWKVTKPAPDMAGFIVYHYNIVRKEGFVIDTIFDPQASGYSADDVILTSSFIESYVVAAFDTAGNTSPLSNYLSTILAGAILDSCNKKIIVSWNRYVPEPYKVTGYDIYASVDGGNYTLSGHVADTVTSFEIDNFVNGSDYSYNVRALLENSQVSSSNKTKSLTAEIQKLPQWINADYATVTGPGEIALSFTIDPSSATDLFVLERKTGESGSFQEIAMIRTTIQSVTYTDRSANLEAANYYVLSAMNSCNLKAVSSNIASNMILGGVAFNNEIRLTWSPYHEWRGTVSSYRLFIDKGSGYNEYAIINSPDTAYSVNLTDIIYSLSAGEACFFVMADEVSNPYGIAGESSSNRVCFTAEETITVPNLFTPDGDLKNDLFKPVLTFTPADYHLVISDRQGRTIFETRDSNESWDGTENGSKVSQGVYMWFLKVRTPSGKIISRTGTVTVYSNRQ